MKNKVQYKKYLIKTLIITILFLITFFILNTLIYKIYTYNNNLALNTIITKVKEEYPNITDNEIMEILNAKDYDKNLLNAYNLNLNNNYILQNNAIYKYLIITNTILLLIYILTIYFLFSKYNHKKDLNILEITNYLKEINRHNYTLDIKTLSEDELSILKNELYKTTVTLKEVADIASNDKQNLKDSLEDISHQLKTPLTSILVMLDNLIDNEDMEKTTKEEFLHNIKQEINNISYLVNTLLKLSKFDANTITLQKEQIKMSKIVKSVLQNTNVLSELKNIKIIVKCPEDTYINGDLHWEVEALTNILKNALEHSYNDSTITIEISKNNVYTLITIKDNGIGIAKEDLPHIFERFYKGKNSSDDSIGIGLALAKTIILKDNGNISVTSNKKGTTFTIKYFNI